MKNGVLEQNVSKCDSSFSSDEVNMEKIERLKEKQDRLNSLMEMKNKQIKMKDEFIQKVLIGKIDKGEGQGDGERREYARDRGDRQVGQVGQVGEDDGRRVPRGQPPVAQSGASALGAPLERL